MDGKSSAQGWVHSASSQTCRRFSPELITLTAIALAWQNQLQTHRAAIRPGRGGRRAHRGENAAGSEHCFSKQNRVLSKN